MSEKCYLEWDGMKETRYTIQGHQENKTFSR